jgi:GT2 family glycosyltransferase
MSTLSIIIPSHSRADLLAACLESVRRFSPAASEVIVVDDGSPDAAASRVAHQFGVDKVIRHDRARGFCAAVMSGIDLARGEIIELLNDDTVVTTGWADAALAHFTDPNIVAVAPLVLKSGSDPVRIDSAGDDYDRGGFAKKRFDGMLHARSRLICEPVPAVSATAGFYRRSAVLRVGGLPQDFGAYFEDVDLSLRLARIGTLFFEPASVVWHHVHASYGQAHRRRLIERQSANEERLFWRNANRSDLPRHLAVLAGKLCRRIEEGHAAPWLSGRVAGLIRQFRSRI